MTLEKIIGNKIRSLRTLKELSQENVAEILGISITASVAFFFIQKRKK